MKFPLKEAEMLDLAQKMKSGFAENPDVFPKPPLSPEDLEQKIENCLKIQDESDAAHAAAAKVRKKKDDVFADLAKGMKKDISYAEHEVDFDNEDLKLIGWAGRKPKKPLEPPGPCSDLKAVRYGEGGVASLIFDMPIKGGKVSAIIVEVLESSETGWRIVATVFTNEARIKHLPRGKVLEFRVIAANKAGHSAPSNVCKITL